MIEEQIMSEKRVIIEWNKCGQYEDFRKDFEILADAEQWVRKQDWFDDPEYWYHIYVLMEWRYCNEM